VQMLVDLLSGHDGFVEGYVHRDDWKDASQHWIDAFDCREWHIRLRIDRASKYFSGIASFSVKRRINKKNKGAIGIH
jgi:hypothetical protein